ncbi:MAG: hypothetical protein M1281_15350 [Chloroflexi bacterium]|nr:hypothetical protein [Chloroflexota bacterium]
MLEDVTRNPKSLKSANLMVRIAAVFVILVLLAGGALLLSSRSLTHPPAQSRADLLTAEQLAGQYGLKVNLVAVTAAGGLIDLRYQVLDAQKARSLFDDPSDNPTLFLPGTQIALVSPDDPQAQYPSVEKGNQYHLLYPNRQNALKPGDAVGIGFGSLRFGPFVAK